MNTSIRRFGRIFNAMRFEVFIQYYQSGKDQGTFGLIVSRNDGKVRLFGARGTMTFTYMAKIDNLLQTIVLSGQDSSTRLVFITSETGTSSPGYTLACY
jgi:hypothetical protein